MNLIDIIKNSTENDYIDFKSQWYEKEKTYALICDILALSNSLSDNPSRYLVIGVDENSETKEKTYCDISNDPNIKKSEDIVQILRNYMSVVPLVEVLRREIDGCKIDIIKITPKFRDLPYVLNRSYPYKQPIKENVENKKLPKNVIYSRNSGQNTPKDESCEKEIAKELFARQRGEHLTPLERFYLYLDDIDGWEYVSNGEVKNYYYKDNYNFKLIRKENDEHIRYVKNTGCYQEILADTGINKEYWDKINFAYDDFYLWFNVEMWAEKTLIKTCIVMMFYSKYYFVDKGYFLNNFYLPPRDYLGFSDIRTKNDIKNSDIWKICKILYKCDLPSDVKFSENECSIILDNLNYDFIEKPSRYIEQNEDWIYKERV